VEYSVSWRILTSIGEDDERPRSAPVVERPTPQHALAAARDLFVSGRRVDMQSVAEACDVARATLYRWFGDRERLMSAVLADLTRSTFEIITPLATGEGLDRVLDTARRVMTVTASFAPLESFATREPKLALRILLNPDGDVARELSDQFERCIADNLPAAKIEPSQIKVIVQLATALEWANVAVGHPPQIEGFVSSIRALVQSAQRIAPVGRPDER
jgi:AcrR family transcriptional regulator